MTFVVDIVTGASQGIGRSIAEYIAIERSRQFLKQGQKQPATYYALALVGRNVERGARVSTEISQSSGLTNIWFESCDISDWDDVNRMKRNILEKGAPPDFQVGILVNNAAECSKTQVLVEKKQRNGGGVSSLQQLDKQFTTNILGYHFMMKMLQDNFSSNIHLAGSSSALEKKKTHIVNIASNWAGDLDLNDLHFRRRHYDNDTAYRQSKQGDRMLSKVWSIKLQDVATVNSCHPGDPCTTLSKALGYNFGCAPPSQDLIKHSPIPFLCGLHDDDATTATGGWYQGRSHTPLRCQFDKMTKESNCLFEICDSFCYQV